MYSFYKENKTPVRRRKYSIMKDFQPSPNVRWMNRPVLNCLESMLKNNRLKAPKPSGLWPVSNKGAETRKKNFRVSAIPLPKRTASPIFITHCSLPPSFPIALHLYFSTFSRNVTHPHRFFSIFRINRTIA